MSSDFLPTNKTLSLSNIRYNVKKISCISGSGPVFSSLKEFDSFLIVSQRLYSMQINLYFLFGREHLLYKGQFVSCLLSK